MFEEVSSKYGLHLKLKREFRFNVDLLLTPFQNKSHILLQQEVIFHKGAIYYNVIHNHSD